MKKLILLGLLIAPAVLLLSSCAAKNVPSTQNSTVLTVAPGPTPSGINPSVPTSSQTSPATTAKVGNQAGNLAPDFKLNNLEGKPVSLSDFRGKPVWLNFWATW